VKLELFFKLGSGSLSFSQSKGQSCQGIEILFMDLAIEAYVYEDSSQEVHLNLKHGTANLMGWDAGDRSPSSLKDGQPRKQARKILYEKLQNDPRAMVQFVYHKLSRKKQNAGDGTEDGQ